MTDLAALHSNLQRFYSAASLPGTPCSAAASTDAVIDYPHRHGAPPAPPSPLKSPPPPALSGGGLTRRLNAAQEEVEAASPSTEEDDEVVKVEEAATNGGELAVGRHAMTRAALVYGLALGGAALMLIWLPILRRARQPLPLPRSYAFLPRTGSNHFTFVVKKR